MFFSNANKHVLFSWRIRTDVWPTGSCTWIVLLSLLISFQLSFISQLKVHTTRLSGERRKRVSPQPHGNSEQQEEIALAPFIALLQQVLKILWVPKAWEKEETKKFKCVLCICFFILFILFMGFSGQEYWSGLPFPSPEEDSWESLGLQGDPTRPS